MIKTVSPSAVNTFAKCGEQYRRRYVEGEKIPPGVALHVGTGVHGAAEENHKAKIESKEDEPEDVIKDAARDKYKKSLSQGVYLTPEEKSRKDKVLGEGQDMAVTLAGLYRRSLAPQIQPIHVEKFVRIEVDELPVPILGVLDVTTEEWVPDLKTAKKSWRQDQADGNLQLAVYKRAFRELTEQDPMVSLEVLVNLKEPKHQHIIADVTDADFDAFVRRAQQMLQSVRAGIFPPADPSHFICDPRWCGYWWTCSYISNHQKQKMRNQLPKEV